MARSDCKVCAREDVGDIETLALEKGPRAAARVVGCSHNAVMRHMANHTGTTPLSPKAIGEEIKAARPTTARLPQVAAYVTAYKAKFPEVARLTSMEDRKCYLANLFRLGRFNGLRTSGHLSLIWDDLGPLEFAELISSVASETNFRRGSEQARRVALLGHVERLFFDSVKAKDRKTAARLLEIWAKLDVPVGVDLMTALASTAAWPLVARELQAKHPEAFETVYGALVAEASRKRQALAPTTIVQHDDVE